MPRSRAGRLWSDFRKRRDRYVREECVPPKSAGTFPLQVFGSTGRPKRLFFFSKRSLLTFRPYTAPLLRTAAVVTRGGGTAEQFYVDAAYALAGGLGQPLVYVGDLDPVDLTGFAVLLRGGPALSRPATPAVRYLGIDDAWWALCLEHLRPKHRHLHPPMMLLRMGPTEREHLKLVDELLPGWERLVGPHCAQLLRDGYKLELEGAANPGLYNPGFPRRLVRHLLSSEPRIAPGTRALVRVVERVPRERHTSR